MPSEKQIEAAHKKASDILDTYVTWEEIIAILTAAEQAEPALAAPCKHPVWGQDNDGTRVCAKCGLVEHPSARTGAVKQLEWQSIDDSMAFRAYLPIIGSIRIEPYGVCGWWEVLWSMPGQCDKLIPDVFDTADEAKAAAQADYEKRILTALEQAEPETDAEPVWFGFDEGTGEFTGEYCTTKPHDTRGMIPFVRVGSHPPESRLREALEKIVGKDSYIDASPRGDRKIVYGDFARIARAALAQGADDECG